MSTIGGTALTLLDIMKLKDPSGKNAKIVEILMQENGLLDDMTWIECNDGDSHETTIRTGLPSGTWRRYNEGVQPTKGTTAQVRAQTGQLEDVSTVDRDLAEKGGQGAVAGVRASEAVAHIEGLSQQMATAVLYEDERTNPGRITGLAAHYASVSTATAASATNVIDAGGTGSDNSSIWFVGWGPEAITGLFPQGSEAGLRHEDEGIVDVQDATGIAGATFRAYRDRFRWKCGVCVRDWRKASRVCNIDISNLRAESSNADLIKKMIMAEEVLAKGAANYAVYMNRTLRTWLRIQALAKATSQVTFETVAGKPVMVWGERFPIRTTDALLNTESRLT
jgi:hypothetical protein